MIEPDPDRIDDTPPASIAEAAANWRARLDKAGSGLVPELRGEDAPTFQCGRCVDTCVVIGRRRVQVFGAMSSTVWWCRCEAGMAAEAGWWFARLYPTDSAGRRHLNTIGKAQFEKYQAEHYQHANLLQTRIDALRHRYERERTRKLDAQESAA